MKRILVAAKLVYNKIAYNFMRSQRDSVHLLNAEDTVKAVIDKGLSVSRFGDGELNMVFSFKFGYNESRKSGFQSFNNSLGKRLTEILGSKTNNNCLICLPGCMLSVGTGYLLRNAALFWEDYTVKYLNTLLSLINKTRVYGETNFSRFYLSHKDKTHRLEFLRYVQKIWDKRDIVIVEGKKTMLGIGNDLFSNANSVRRILCPPTDAWSKYDEILVTVKNCVPIASLSNNIAMGGG